MPKSYRVVPLSQMKNLSTMKPVCAEDLKVSDDVFSHLWYADDVAHGQSIDNAFIIAYSPYVLCMARPDRAEQYNNAKTRNMLREKLRESVNNKQNILFLPPNSKHVDGIEGMCTFVPYVTNQLSTLDVVQSLMHMCTTDGVIVEAGYKSPYFVSDMNPLRTSLEPCNVFIVDKLDSIAIADKLVAKYAHKNIAVFAKSMATDCLMVLVINSIREKLGAVVVLSDDLQALCDYTRQPIINQEQLLDDVPRRKFVVNAYSDQTLVETHSSER